MNNVIVYSEKQYKMALKELSVILKHIPKVDFEKIPKDILEAIENNAEQNYDFNLDLNKKIDNQNISELTKAMLENIYKNYWITEIEKNKIIQEECKQREKIEQEKNKRYNPDDIFKKSNIINENTEQLALVNIQAETWYKKIFKFIKKILNIK